MSDPRRSRVPTLEPTRAAGSAVGVSAEAVGEETDGPRDLRSLVGKGTLHFMGIAGAGMCALAEAVLRGGLRVTGCDLDPGRAVQRLERMGVRILNGHDPGHVDGVGGLVVSSAIPSDHPEIQEAMRAGIPVLKRAEALGGWVNPGRVVGVAGSHGKTTTSAMMTHVLEAAGRDPTGFVGGEVVAWNGHLRPGSETLFVVEADEYDRSFHQLRPDLAIVTNVEADHLDIYGSLEGVRDAFKGFLGKVKPGGVVVACADDPGAAALLPGAAVSAVSYGFSAGSVIRGSELEGHRGGVRFRVWEEGRSVGHLWTQAPGLHNARNALAAATAARCLEVDWKDIRRGLEAFRGVRRRFERLGEAGGVLVIDDYAHHPTEIKAALSAARGLYPERRIVAVFQPHLYSRTRDLATEFGEALGEAHEIWVTDVYPAREKPIPGVSGELISNAAENLTTRPVHYLARLESLPESLAGRLEGGEVCVLMGAGSIDQMGPRLLDRLSGEGPEGEARGRGAHA